MKTIAITIDADLLERLERAVRKAGQPSANRSRAIRIAVEEHVLRLERAADEAREAALVRRHRSRLAKEGRALIGEQAKP